MCKAIARGVGVVLWSGVLLCGPRVHGQGAAPWQRLDAQVGVSDTESLVRESVPPSGMVVPAPDGALAGVTLLAGLAAAYWIRHQRARRNG